MSRAESSAPLVIHGERATFAGMILAAETYPRANRSRMPVEQLPEYEHHGEQMTGPTGEPTPDEMCVVLARELRTPLSTIEGYLDLLAAGGVGQMTEEQREFLDVVIRNVHRLSGVVTDWLDLARLEAGRYPLTREPVDLLDVADRAVAEIRPRVWGKEQQITVDAPAEPAEVLGDTRALMHVVSNLVSNAHKYTPRGGRIRLALSSAGDAGIRLAVQDTGIGIRDEDQRNLFRKFFRADITEAEPGTGLGLTLVNALVERMGGRIEVSSTFGQGSTFTVVLPHASTMLPSEAGPEPAAGAGAGLPSRGTER